MTTLRAEQQGLTRSRLLDAASNLFATQGLSGTSVAMVAEQAGVSTGAIYSNFTGKEDLFAAVVERHMARQAEQYRELYSIGSSPAEQLESGAQRWMALIDEEPKYFPLFVEVWRVSLADAAIRRRLRTAYRKLIAELALLIRDGSDAAWPEMDDAAVDAFATIICALADGMALHRTLDPKRVSPELFGSFLRLVVESVPPGVNES